MAALIWLAATFDQDSRQLVRNLIGIVALAVALHAVVIGRYFFALPLCFDAVVVVLLTVGWASLRADPNSEISPG